MGRDADPSSTHHTGAITNNAPHDGNKRAPYRRTQRRVYAVRAAQWRYAAGPQGNTSRASQINERRRRHRSGETGSNRFISTNRAGACHRRRGARASHESQVMSQHDAGTQAATAGWASHRGGRCGRRCDGRDCSDPSPTGSAADSAAEPGAPILSNRSVRKY